MTLRHRPTRPHAPLTTLTLSLTLALALAACGGGHSRVPAQEKPPPAESPSPAPVAAAPVIAAVSPATGFMKGGATVTLTGSGLGKVTAVRFGNTAATAVTVVSDTQITVTTPEHSAGLVDVVVTSPDGAGTATDGFSYSIAGQINTVAGGGSGADGSPATSAQLSSPIAVLEDPAGNLLVGDYQGNRVRVVAKTTGNFYGIAMTAGAIYTIAGTGTMASTGDNGPATAASFSQITGLAFDRDGNLAISDYQGSRIRLLATADGTFYGIAMTAGNVYTIAGGGASTPDDIAGTSARLRQPVGLARDTAGNILVAGYQDNRVYVIAARTGSHHGRAMTAGSIYTLAGTGTSGFGGDGGSAASATMSWPIAVAADADGHVLVADYQNQRVRAIAGATGIFYGVAMSAGSMYTIAGTGTSGTAGDGGSPLAATLASPSGLVFDAAGHLVIATSAGRLRAIASSTQTRYAVALTAGDIHTVAGAGTTTTDDGPAIDAALGNPFGMGVEASGRLLVTDFARGRVRSIAP